MADLDIVNAKFENAHTSSVDELFDGYSRLLGMTFSTDSNFIYKITKKFDYAEVVFGSSIAVPSDLQNIQLAVASGIELIDDITKSKSAAYIASRLKDESLAFFMARGRISHAKVFILSDDMREHNRVIVGSANFSGRGFGGIQKENLVVFDDDEAAYDFYLRKYMELRDEVSDRVSSEIVISAIEDNKSPDEMPEKTPLVEALLGGESVSFATPSPSAVKEEREVVARIRGVEDRGKTLKSRLPRMRRRKNQLFADKSWAQGLVKNWKNSLVEVSKKKKEEKDEYHPQITFDLTDETVEINGKEVSLDVSAEDVDKDVSVVKQVMKGTESFIGDSEETKREFWKFMVWWFGSVFFAELRDRGNYVGQTPTAFPEFAILYGRSNAGKSKLCELLQKLMMPDTTINPVDTIVFTQTQVAALRDSSDARAWKGMPIYFDDMDKDRWRDHANKVVKDDAFGLGNPAVPAVAITSNDVPALDESLSKRVVCCRVDARLTNVAASKGSTAMSQMFRNITGALFLQFMKDMLPRVRDMYETMGEDADNFPDMFELTSTVLSSYIDEPWAKILTYNDYFGERTLGKAPLEFLDNEWKINKEAFTVNKKSKRVVYAFSKEFPGYRRGWLEKELPPTLDSKFNGDLLDMNAEALGNFLGIDLLAPQNPLEFIAGFFAK